MKQTFLRKNLIALLVVCFVFFLSFTTISAEEELIDLKILHTNDMHAKINDFGKIAAYITAERNEADYSLYLDAGDIFSGNPVVDLQYGYPIIDLLNQMQLDAMTIGNHEFDYGQEETVKRKAQSNFPWLSANTNVTTGTLVDFPQPDPYTIIDVNGLTVGVFSLTQTPPATGPLNIVGLEFRDPIATAKEYEFLKNETDILIALTHVGFPEDQRLATEVDFFDVIIGGHSHTTLTEPVIVNGTPIVQTGSNATNIGNLTIQYKPETDEVVTVNGFLQAVEGLEAIDEEIHAQVLAYNEEMNELLDQVIGNTTTGLLRTDRYSTDAPLGNFWTDAMRYHTSADIAFTNNGGLRADIEPGELTVGDIYTVEPFENEIMTIEMTGAALKDVLEYSYSRDGRNQVDLQTSGLHYTILTDAEGKFVDVSIEVNGEPIEDEAKYIVAISDYIGSGGSGYNFVGEVIEPLTGKMTEAMIDHALDLTEQGQAVDYYHEGRITVKEFEEEVEEPIEEEPILHPVIEAEISVSENDVHITDESISILADDGILIINLPADEDMLEVHFTEEQLQTLVAKNVQIHILRVNEVALEFAAETFAENEQLSVKLERLETENPLSAVYDFTILDGDAVLTKFAENLTIVFIVNEEEVNDAEKVKIYRTSGENQWAEVESFYENGLVFGLTDHFSTFTVFEELPGAEPEEETGDDSASDGDENRAGTKLEDKNQVTPGGKSEKAESQPGKKLPATASSMFNWMAIGLTLLVVGISLFIYRKRKMNLEA